MIGLNKLECYITLDWKGLAVTNILAYWAHNEKKMKCCEYATWCQCYKTLFFLAAENVVK
jgi:hypothetical protein